MKGYNFVWFGAEFWFEIAWNNLRVEIQSEFEFPAIFQNFVYKQYISC